MTRFYFIYGTLTRRHCLKIIETCMFGMQSSLYSRPLFSTARLCRSSTDRHPRLHTHMGQMLHNKGRGIYVKTFVSPEVTKVSTLPRLKDLLTRNGHPRHNASHYSPS